MRPTLFESVLPFDEALAIVVGAATPDRTRRDRSARGRGRTRGGARRRRRASTSRPSIARRWTATPSSPTTRPARRRERPRSLRLVGGVFTGDVAGARHQRRRMHGDFDRRAAPAGATAVVMVEDTTRSGDTIRVERGGPAGSEHRPPWIGHDGRTDGRFRRRCADPEPRRRDRRGGRGHGRGLRPADGCGAVHGQ